jgi:hypothetical protein
MDRPNLHIHPLAPLKIGVAQSGAEWRTGVVLRHYSFSI